MTHPDSTLYIEVVRITHSYLGPAADRFISRQITSHLHKEPDELSRQDLLMLIDWVQIAMSLLTDDEAIIKEYIRKLQHLTIQKSEVKEVHRAA